MKNSKIKLFFYLIIIFITFSLNACLGGDTSEPTRYYTIAVENINIPKIETNDVSKKSVYIKKFSIDKAYQRNNIVYRESAYDFMFYDLDLWASRPDQMITQIVNEYFNKSNLFLSVDTKNISKPDYEVIGHIDCIEEIDEKNSEFAKLSLKIKFIKTDNNIPLFEKNFNDTIKMNKREPRYMAEGISKLLGKYIEETLTEISKKSL